MKMTYWIAERKDGKAHLILRANTREEINEFVRKNDLRAHYDLHYDIPREVTIETDNILSVVKDCVDKESYNPLPWEKK